MLNFILLSLNLVQEVGKNHNSCQAVTAYSFQVSIYYCFPLFVTPPPVPVPVALDIDPMLDQSWATVYDAGPTLVQHWVDV